MPLIYFSRVLGDREEYFFTEKPPTTSQPDDVVSTSPHPGESDFISQYQQLPGGIKSCLDYCSFVTFKHSVDKDKIVRLLLAVEGLLPQTPGKLLEEAAEIIVEDLIYFGFLRQELLSSGLRVDDSLKELCLHQVGENKFFDKAADSPVFVLVYDDGKGTPPDFHGLEVHSLFIMTLERRLGQRKDRCLSQAYMESVCRLQSLVVLEFEGIVECLPDGIGNMVHLKYLGLYLSRLDQLPKALFDLGELLALDIRGCVLGKWHELPVDVLKMKQLRHLLMSHNVNNCEITVPKSFGTMTNLRTCDGVYAGGETAKELGNLTDLRKLSVQRVADDHSDELAASIMKMENLVFLSLEAEGNIFKGTLFPEMEHFHPPKLLREVSLFGGLADVPTWLFEIENLTTLSLSFSRLLENQISVLQGLRNLKRLTLWNSCDAKYLSKGFCDAGGFKELEILEIASMTLVEWGEIVDGAFPSLRVLIFRNCTKLKFLPDGLRNISTLKQLCIFPVYNDIAKRLLDEENYKIKHIEDFLFHSL